MNSSKVRLPSSNQPTNDEDICERETDDEWTDHEYD